MIAPVALGACAGVGVQLAFVRRFREPLKARIRERAEEYLTPFDRRRWATSPDNLFAMSRLGLERSTVAGNASLPATLLTLAAALLTDVAPPAAIALAGAALALGYGGGLLILASGE